MDFNFETEITKFYDWLENRTDITPFAIALWFALMESWKSENYPDEVVVNPSTFKSKTRLDSAALKVAADILADSGRIRYARDKGKRTFRCKIIPFVSDSAEQQSYGYDSHSRESNAESVVESHYKRIFRKLPTEDECENIEKFINMGVQESLICGALDITKAKERKTWAYTKGIIRNWIESGIFSLDDLEKNKEESTRKREKKERGTSAAKPKNNNKPDKYLPPEPLKRKRNNAG